MKKFKALSLLIVFILAVSVTGFSTGTQLGDNGNGTYTVNYAGITGEEYSLLVVKSGVQLENLAEGDILYIDQTTAAGNTATFASFKLRVDVDADVYVGGESMVAPVLAHTIDITPVAQGELVIPQQPATPAEKIFVPDTFEPATVTIPKSQNGSDEPIVIGDDDKYGVMSGAITESYSGWELIEWGVELSRTNELAQFTSPAQGYRKCPADKSLGLTANGKFGMFLYGEGLKNSEVFYTRIYATYLENGDTSNTPVTKYGDIETFIQPTTP